MIVYDKLFDFLERKHMKKTDLLEVITAKTLAKLGKHKSMNTRTIEKICLFLECQPGDIMEHVKENKTEGLKKAP
ncbi:helix-turn-helix domain-containing protein [Lachnospiraceae bacterium 62-35]